MEVFDLGSCRLDALDALLVSSRKVLLRIAKMTVPDASYNVLPSYSLDLAKSRKTTYSERIKWAYIFSLSLREFKVAPNPILQFIHRSVLVRHSRVHPKSGRQSSLVLRTQCPRRLELLTYNRDYIPCAASSSPKVAASKRCCLLMSWAGKSPTQAEQHFLTPHLLIRFQLVETFFGELRIADDWHSRN